MVSWDRASLCSQFKLDWNLLLPWISECLDDSRAGLSVQAYSGHWLLVLFWSLLLEDIGRCHTVLSLWNIVSVRVSSGRCCWMWVRCPQHSASQKTLLFLIGGKTLGEQFYRFTPGQTAHPFLEYEKLRRITLPVTTLSHTNSHANLTFLRKKQDLQRERAILRSGGRYAQYWNRVSLIVGTHSAPELYISNQNEKVGPTSSFTKTQEGRSKYVVWIKYQEPSSLRRLIWVSLFFFLFVFF